MDINEMKEKYEQLDSEVHYALKRVLLEELYEAQGNPAERLSTDEGGTKMATAIHDFLVFLEISYPDLHGKLTGVQDEIFGLLEKREGGDEEHWGLLKQWLLLSTQGMERFLRG